MHPRHRIMSNGYRSGSTGMGLSASRISPEGSTRGNGFYGSLNRGFNRGYGHGRGREPPKLHQHQPPPPVPLPQRKGGDIFMEAGRLAAEYLVSQGVLPPVVLSGKWQNGNSRKQGGDFQGFRSQEARMGVSASDAGRRRYVDDYSSMGSRSNLKGRRSSRYGSDIGRDYVRSGSWSDRNKPSEMDVDDDCVSGHQGEQPIAEDNASSLQRSASGDFIRKGEGAGDSETELDKYNLQDEAQSKTGSSSAGKEIVHDGEISKISEGSSSLSPGSAEVKGGTGDVGETENQATVEDSSVQQSGQADEAPDRSGVDLVTLCKFAKVPTKTRSSLTIKGPKVGLSEDIGGSSHNSGLSNDTVISNRCGSSGQSSGKADDPECPDEENFNSAHQVEHVRDLGPANVVEKGNCHKSHSFPEGILRDNVVKNSGLELPDLHRSYSVGLERGEKRAAEDSDLGEGAKRQREWLPSLASTAQDCFGTSSVSEIKGSPEEGKTDKFEETVMESTMKVVDQDGLVSNSIHPQIQDEKSCMGYAEERQLFPGSFKICDLNLEGASDMNESNLRDPMITFPAIAAAKKEPDQVDFDLSISSSSKSLEHTTRLSNGKEIEVIDLENDSPEVKASNISDSKQEAAYMGFSHQPQVAAEIHDVPDYNEGLMMVEFLDSFGNIPPMNPGGISNVPQNVNPLQNEIGLQNPEGSIGTEQVSHADDDSIFMSLGEIPLTFLQAWDQPPSRTYEKPF